MDLERLYGGSFVGWDAVGASWAKRTVSSRLLLFSARRYLSSTDPGEKDDRRATLIEPVILADEIKVAFASPPTPESTSSSLWGEFIDAALAAELEMIPYGERPILLAELRAGFSKAADEAGRNTPLRRWFLARRDALPGEDLPEDPEYLPV